MELTKAVVRDRGIVKTGEDGKRWRQYLFLAIVITDEDVDRPYSGDTILMGETTGEIGDAIRALAKYQPPYSLGDADDALITLSHLSPDDLTRKGMP